MLDAAADTKHGKGDRRELVGVPCDMRRASEYGCSRLCHGLYAMCVCVSVCLSVHKAAQNGRQEGLTGGAGAPDGKTDRSRWIC